MSRPRDDWDADEHDTLGGLEGELAEIRRRHQGDPPLAMLRAADAEALPEELQAQVSRHLQGSAWSRAVIAGLRDAGADDRLDAAAEDRLFERIRHEAQAAAPPPARRWNPGVVFGGLALAATVLIAVFLPRSTDAPAGPAPAAPPSVVAPTAAAPAPPATPRVSFTKPDVKLSPRALTWRGDQSNPFLTDLTPAFDAYRANDYPTAVAAFDRLALTYADSIEVLFYQGVSRMLAGDEAGAVPALEAAARLRNAAFADDVSWFLAVARQRSGGADTRGAFAEICKSGGPHAAPACEAVAQLDAASPSSPKP